MYDHLHKKMPFLTTTRMDRSEIKKSSYNEILCYFEIHFQIMYYELTEFGKLDCPCTHPSHILLSPDLENEMLGELLEIAFGE